MRYMLLIYDNEAVDAEVRQTEYPQWLDYTTRLREAGAMLGGEPLEPTTAATTVRGKSGSGHKLTDGPYAETKEALGGFYMIDVPDLDKATEWAAQMPHVARGGIVEVRPIMELEDQ